MTNALSPLGLLDERGVGRPETWDDLRLAMRALRHTVYVLLDISGSMFGGDAWRIRIGKGVALWLSRRCRNEGASFLFRAFCERSHPLQEVGDDARQAAFEAFLRTLGSGGGTAIGPAIQQAIDDCLRYSFDSCDVMIVTDGEDNALDIVALRERLAANGIRLHAILLDVNNHALQQIANVYQQIPSPGIVSPPIVRPPS